MYHKKTSALFVITGTGAKGPFTVNCEEFFQTDAGIIILGTVTKGTIYKGDNIVLNLSGSSETISDSVKELQIEKRAVDCADTGKGIGICLTNTTMAEMEAFNKEALV